MPAPRLPHVSTLLLLDGHSLAYRAFYALPAENFSTSTGQHTNAVYGFTSMLINVLRDEAPTHLAVAFDKSRQTFRTEEYAEYKAGRSATPSEFAGQVPLLQEVLTALRVPFLEMDGFEADDIIATLTTQARAQDMDVLICSGDRDALQLVSDRVTVLYPVKGVSELARMTPEAVEAKYGVRPERYSDLAALVGESAQQRKLFRVRKHAEAVRLDDRRVDKLGERVFVVAALNDDHLVNVDHAVSPAAMRSSSSVRSSSSSSPELFMR